MNFKELESVQKLGGVYYTPKPIASFLAQWINSCAPQSVLEPSCGDGAFLEALSNLHPAPYDVQITALDIDTNALNIVQEKFAQDGINGLKPILIERDFLEFSLQEVDKATQYDAVIGNPPFIRYQYLNGAHQQRTESIFQSAGLRFTKHTNAWVPFVIQGIRLLRPGGRLGMVVPAEIMHVLHANSLRQFLLSECSEISVVHLNDVFADDVLQGIVLLLCTKAPDPHTNRAQISFPSASNEQLVNGNAVDFLNRMPFASSENLDYKWMEALLEAEELQVYQKAKQFQAVQKFSDIASVDVGIVTGANKFFLVNDETVARYGLDPYVYPMFGRSAHVRGAIVTKEDIRANGKAGLPANFVHFPPKPKSHFPASVQKYIALGEHQKLHTRYKCRIRTPWYVVPSVWAADVAMLKRAHETPRLLLNAARAYTTDTAYRITPKTDSGLTGEQLVWNFFNSLTALSAELEGRHYGGGVIELVPSEIERLVVPLRSGGAAELNELDTEFRNGTPVDTILRAQDEVILAGIGLDSKERALIHSAWKRLKRRRQRAEN